MEGYHITWMGSNVAEIDQAQRQFVMTKIMEYCRGAPVRAKVMHIQNTIEYTEDSIGVCTVHGMLYFLSISDGFLFIIDMHYIKNALIAQLLEINSLIELD